jgi:hypothetical protein
MVKLETIRKESVGVQTGYKPGIFIEKLQKPRKILKDDTRYSFRNSNQVPLDTSLKQGCPEVVGKLPQLLWCAGLRAAGVEVKIRGIHKPRIVV